MKGERDMAQWKRDVLYGVGLIATAIFLFIETIGWPTGGVQYFVAQSSTYVRLLLSTMVILSVSIIVKAVSKKDETPTPVIWNKLGVLTVIVVIVYLFVMDKIGFIASTFVIISFLTCLYSNRLGKFQSPEKKERMIQLVKYLVFSAIVTIAVYFIFTAGLDVNLPKFDLF